MICLLIVSTVGRFCGWAFSNKRRLLFRESIVSWSRDVKCWGRGWGFVLVRTDSFWRGGIEV